eukprot:m.130902 g.130902  ORF g.130902 m.130902 type:complete len:50 (-) comp52359_c0_seq27:779-928(-)
MPHFPPPAPPIHWRYLPGTGDSCADICDSFEDTCQPGALAGLTLSQVRA